MEILHTNSADGTRLRLARWGKPGRNLLIVPGLAEHAGRYVYMGEKLAAAGWQVTCVELRGHGESEGRRGHVRSWMKYVEDFQAAAAVAGGDLNPVVVVAHSMGGLVALDALRAPVHPPIRALALCNPLLRSKVQVPGWKRAASGLLSRFLPFLPIDNELDTAGLTRNTALVRAYEDDPLVFGTVTPRWFTEHHAAIERVLAYAPTYHMPLRMMVGTDDIVCDHKAGLDFAGRWGGPAEPVVYDGYYHELFNEPERDAVIGDMARWLDEQELS